MLRKFLVIFLVCVVVSGVKLPSFFKKCRKRDPNLAECVKNSGNAAMDQLANGLKQIRFPSLRPLDVPFMRLDIGDSLKLKLTDNKIYGIDKIHIENVIVNITAGKYTFEIFLDRLEQLGTYDVNGRILVLPVFGHGPINATFINSNITFKFDFEINKDGYMVPNNPRYSYVADRVYFRLENLFDGNELLGSEINKFIDENWKDVNEEIGTKLGDVIGELLVEILKGFMGRVYFEDMFEKEENI